MLAVDVLLNTPADHIEIAAAEQSFDNRLVPQK